MKRYFKVELTDGEILDFGKKCTDVDYGDYRYVRFKYLHETDRTCHDLAIIPHSSIFCITVVEED